MAYTQEFFRKRLEAQLRTLPATNGHPTADPDALIRIPGDRDFLMAAYRSYLGRDCDLSGMVHHLESLQNHVPRRVVLARIAESDEARARQSSAAQQLRSLPGKEDRDGVLARFKRRVAVRVRDLARQLILNRFDSIDYRLNFILEEMAARTGDIAKKSDDALAALATKSDTYFAETWQRQREADTALGQRIDAIQRELRELASRVHPPILQAGNVLATEAHGFILGVPAAEWRMAAYLAFRGPLEPGLTHLVERIVRPGMTVADIGANIGFYTLLAARLLGGAGKVYSFEPTPGTFEILRDNIQVNGFLESGIVDCRAAAVADAPGSLRLFTFSDDSGHNTLYWEDPDTPHVEVPAVTLDDALDGASVDFVKIDVEGAEPAVLAGMRRTIAANPLVRIVIEFAPGHLHRARHKPVEFLAQLRAEGFAIHRIDALTGDLSPARDADLLCCFSENLLLSRNALDGGPA
ncbi:MAG: FkbM family methyltransferase [Bryobacteraceae bacterium]